MSAIEYAYYTELPLGLYDSHNDVVFNLRTSLNPKMKGAIKFETSWIGSAIIKMICRCGYLVIIDPYDERFVSVMVYKPDFEEDTTC